MKENSFPDRNQDEPQEPAAESGTEETVVGQDGPIAQGDARYSDVPEEINPGDEFVLIDPVTEDIIDLSDVEEMEAYASIANTGGVPAVIDSDTEQISDFTQDQDTRSDFAERQQLSGTRRLISELREYTQLSPEISGNDLDADWQSANQSGEESVGGSVPTPDQDVVEELGQALGITYRDEEPLNTEDKLTDRDQNRWELNPASQADQEEEGGILEGLDDGDNPLPDGDEEEFSLRRQTPSTRAFRRSNSS